MHKAAASDNRVISSIVFSSASFPANDVIASSKIISEMFIVAISLFHSDTATAIAFF